MQAPWNMVNWAANIQAFLNGALLRNTICKRR